MAKPVLSTDLLEGFSGLMLTETQSHHRSHAIQALTNGTAEFGNLQGERNGHQRPR